MAALCAGCPALGIAAAGTLQGQILYGGRPAPGKTVSLLVFQNGGFTAFDGSAGTALTTTTDVNGNYKFVGIPAGTYQVEYLPQPVYDGQGLPLPTGEIARWDTLPGTVSNSAGTTFPPFDVTYDGLLYPQPDQTYYVTAQIPLPFHWSTDVQGQRYQLQLFRGQEAASRSSLINLPWTSDPTALFKSDVNPDSYSWDVEIDGGNAGTGYTIIQPLHMGPPLGPATGSAG